MNPEIFAQMTIAVCEMITEIVRGQSPEVKKQLWDWYIEDVKNVRAFFGVKT